MEAYAREIIDLHQHFEDWYCGRLPKTREEAARAPAVMADGFVLITPDGRLFEREELVPLLFEGHNTRHDFRMWIENLVLRQRIGDLLIVTYEEWQMIDNQTTRRSSTVVFREQPATPNGLVWLHVHESGLQVIASR